MPKLAHGVHDYFCCYFKDFKHTTPQLFSRNCLVFVVDFTSHSVIYQHRGWYLAPLNTILEPCIAHVLSFEEE